MKGIKFNRITRRQFLEGIGGTMVAIPLLPSILSPDQASAQVGAPAPRILTIYVGHGAITEPYLYGDYETSISWTNEQILPGHVIRHGDLPSGNLSPLFNAAFNSIKRKMTVVRGLDTLQYLAHNRSLGTGLNFLENPPSHAVVRVQPSLDQFLAQSPTFFNQQPTPHRSIISNSRGGTSAALVRTGAGDRDYGYLAARSSARELFDLIFAGASSGGGADTTAIERVFPAYTALRNSTRISQEDRQRLESHLQALQELQQRIELTVDCGAVPRPPSLNEGAELTARQNVHNLNDVIIAALRCGQTRVANMFLTENSAPAFSYDLHQTIHAYGNSESHLTWFNQVQWQFENVVSDLLRKMDLIEEANGKTMLDNMLVVLHWENFIPHDNFDSNIVLFGGLNGKFRMGKFYDYRNRAIPFRWGSNATSPGYPGIPQNALFNSIIDAYGIPKSEYEQPRTGAYLYGGYSPFFADNNWGGAGGVLGRSDLMSRYYIPTNAVLLNNQFLPGGLYIT